MANELERYMSRANERLMSCAQRTLDELGYILDDMERIADQCPGREDVRACIDEVKVKAKKAMTECWAAANHWSEHFDGLCNGDKTENDDPTEKEKKPVKKTDGE